MALCGVRLALSRLEMLPNDRERRLQIVSQRRRATDRRSLDLLLSESRAVDGAARIERIAPFFRVQSVHERDAHDERDERERARRAQRLPGQHSHRRTIARARRRARTVARGDARHDLRSFDSCVSSLARSSAIFGRGAREWRGVIQTDTNEGVAKVLRRCCEK
jgi:hypothetical protein